MAEPTQKPETMTVSTETRLTLVERQVDYLTKARSEIAALQAAPLATPVEKVPRPSALAEALARAQGAFGIVEKNRLNGFTSTRYADLSSVLAAVRPALAENGLAVTQRSKVEWEKDLGRGTVTVRTTLLHASGETLVDELALPVLPMPRNKKDGGEESFAKCITPQAIGVAIAYARRYSLSELLGVAPEEEEPAGEESTKTKGQRLVQQAVEQQAKKKTPPTEKVLKPPTPAALRTWSTEDLEKTIEGTKAQLERVKGDKGREDSGMKYLGALLDEKSRRFSQLGEETDRPAAPGPTA